MGQGQFPPSASLGKEGFPLTPAGLGSDSPASALIRTYFSLRGNENEENPIIISGN